MPTGEMASSGKKTNLAPGWDTDVTALSPRQDGLQAGSPAARRGCLLPFDTVRVPKSPPSPTLPLPTHPRGSKLQGWWTESDYLEVTSDARC